MQRYLYLPRLRSRSVFEKTVTIGAGSRDFFGTANDEQEGKFDGFRLGDPHVQVDDTLLLIEPAGAAAYEQSHQPPAPTPTPDSPSPADPIPSSGERLKEDTDPSPVAPEARKWKFFSGAAEINPVMAKMKLGELTEEIIGVLAKDPTASVRVSVEIEAEFQDGASDATRRVVSENAKQLQMKRAEWS